MSAVHHPPGYNTYVLGNDDGKESTSVPKQICDQITRVSADVYYTFRSVCQSVSYYVKHSVYPTNSVACRQHCQIMYQCFNSHNILRRYFCYKSHRASHYSITNEVQIRILKKLVVAYFMVLFRQWLGKKYKEGLLNYTEQLITQTRSKATCEQLSHSSYVAFRLDLLGSENLHLLVLPALSR